jgi:hypothetical protein
MNQMFNKNWRTNTMKTFLATVALLLMSFFFGAVSAQPLTDRINGSNGYFDYELSLPLDGPTIPEALKDMFFYYPWDIGEGCYGTRYEQFKATYDRKKELLDGQPCTPYFHLLIDGYYFEGQLFYHSVSKISGLIRGFDGNYYAVSSDFLLTIFRDEYLCLGLPGSDWSKQVCRSSGLTYKKISFTTLDCFGESQTLTLAGLYKDISYYAGCLNLRQLPWCPVPIIVTEDTAK